MKIYIVVALAFVAFLAYTPTAQADTDVMDEIRSLDVFRLK